MVFFEPILPGLLLIVFFVIWNLRERTTVTVKKILARLLFLLGCFWIFCYYMMPLPITPVGFWAIADDLLPVDEAIRLVPFQQMIECRNHLDYYFSAERIRFFCGAILMGVTCGAVGKKPFSLRKNLLLAVLLPFSMFAFYAALRLITGAMLKCADITDIIWFLLFYSIGYGVFRATTKENRKGTPAE